MKCSADVLLYFCGFAHSFSEVTDKSWISIWYDALENSKPGEDVIKIELRYTFAIYGLVAG